MLNNKNILKKFDDLTEAKRKNVFALKLIVSFSFLIVLAVLLWAFSLYISTLNQVKVVDRLGNVVKADLENEKSLRRSLIENHCANTVYYLNSFNRSNVKEHQARALFLLNPLDADIIFSKFTGDKTYQAALMNGVVFQTTYDKLLNIQQEQEPYRVVFQSILSVYDNSEKPTQRYLVVSQGELIHTTAQYPENPVGLYFKNYSQEFKKLTDD